ncbi:hypothetical protein PDE_05491 [Penicillium oxalicum 114-2]|uniref:Uncharacterized protein n=1 Tax=Penicillium oxalicum (strain 114-2 / CGMCC 5302) TaxID=933388 RepID=S7ZJP8_PENO1|nr:hypothetical protein PDE_05491 [Penicillium oxalicum 114-2]
MNVFGRSGMVPSGKSAQFRQVVSSTHEVQYINHAIAGIAPFRLVNPTEAHRRGPGALDLESIARDLPISESSSLNKQLQRIGNTYVSVTLLAMVELQSSLDPLVAISTA